MPTQKCQTENKRSKKVMITLAGGGHLWQSLSVINKLRVDHEFCFVSTRRSNIPKSVSLPVGEIFYINDVATISTRGYWKRISGLTKSFFASLKAIRTARPSVVVGVGTAISVPVLLAAKLLGVPGVFIESVTRVNDLSTTGLIILRLRLADRLYVQWPEVHEKHRKTLYRGTVM